MDHLPTSEPNFHHITVPYCFYKWSPYTYNEQSIGGFSSFPERNGWDTRKLLQDGADFTQGSTKTLYQASSMLQAWLYFGALHFMTAIPVLTEEFLVEEFGRPVVSSRNLPRYLSAWGANLMGLPKKNRLKHIEMLDGAPWALVENYYKGILQTSPTTPEVIFSMMVLRKTVTYFKLSIAPNSSNPTEIWYGGTKEMIDARLYENGWCRSDVYRLHQRLSSLALYYAVSMGPRRTNRSHTGCNDRKCAALKTDDKNYIQRHMEVDCPCEEVQMDEVGLKSIIRSGHTPIITFSEEDGFQMSGFKSEEPGSADNSYVAISHIWSDGLGNPTSNSMLLCQLTRLQERVNALANGSLTAASPRPFWIDTLCVPSQDCDEKRIAIIAMADIYKQASWTLVLDSELDNVPSGAAPVEIAMRILISPWWTRLWTLQEGIYSKSIWFQLGDAAVNESQIRSRSQEDEMVTVDGYWNVAHSITDEALKVISSLATMANDMKLDQGRYFLQSVNWRFTSRADDEVICLAILLFSGEEATTRLTELQRTTGTKERLKKFILMQKCFPSTALFWGRDSVGSMEDEGFRWAPNALVERFSNITIYMLKNPSDFGRRSLIPDTAYADSRGFHVEYPGTVLTFDDVQFRPKTGQRRIQFFHDEGLYEIDLAIPSTATVDWSNMDRSKKIAAIYPRYLTMSTDDRFLQGVLTSISEENDGSIYARYLSPIQVKLLQFPLPADSEQMRALNGNGITATMCPKDQKWCVG